MVNSFLSVAGIEVNYDFKKKWCFIIIIFFFSFIYLFIYFLFFCCFQVITEFDKEY